MADGWFIKRNDQKHGPYSSTQLVEMAKKGQVLPLDWVVRGEKGQWMPASQIKGLFASPEAAAAPPSLPPAVSLPSPASVPAQTSGRLLRIIPIHVAPPIIGMSAVVLLSLLASFFCGSALVFILSFLHNVVALACIVLTTRLQKSVYPLLAGLLTMTVWGWYCFTAVWTAVAIFGLLAGIGVGSWALFALFAPETRRQFADPSLPAQLARWPFPALAGILGGGSLTLILGISMVLWLTTGSNNDGGRSVSDGGDRKMKERTIKSRVGGSDGTSFMEKAITATGAKPNPSIKPAEPESLQDCFDALALMCLRMHNAPIRPGAKIGIYFDDPGCKASTWHEVFGEPELLPRGRERIGKTEIEFERWRHKCTNGSLTFQGQILERDGKISYYSPKFILVD
jgi:uncharacterized protein DUF4339